jgi:hypothetical protein
LNPWHDPFDDRAREGGIMYAVITKVSVAPGRFDEAVSEANSMVIPMLKSQAGYVVSYFHTNADHTEGQSIAVFQSKDQAEASAAAVAPPAESAVSLESVEVREVIASG